MTERLGPQISQASVSPEFWPLDAALLPSVSLAPGQPAVPLAIAKAIGLSGPCSALEAPRPAPAHPWALFSALSTHIWGSKNQVTDPERRAQWEQLAGSVPRPFKAKEPP